MTDPRYATADSLLGSMESLLVGWVMGYALSPTVVVCSFLAGFLVYHDELQTGGSSSHASHRTLSNFITRSTCRGSQSVNLLALLTRIFPIYSPMRTVYGFVCSASECVPRCRRSGVAPKPTAIHCQSRRTEKSERRPPDRRIRLFTALSGEQLVGGHFKSGMPV